jgi:hypothetical protein
MNEVLQFLRDFGSLVNAAIILSLAGIAFGIFRATIAKKDAELAAFQRETNAYLLNIPGQTPF